MALSMMKSPAQCSSPICDVSSRALERVAASDDDLLADGEAGLHDGATGEFFAR